MIAKTCLAKTAVPAKFSASIRAARPVRATVVRAHCVRSCTLSVRHWVHRDYLLEGIGHRVGELAGRRPDCSAYYESPRLAPSSRRRRRPRRIACRSLAGSHGTRHTAHGTRHTAHGTRHTPRVAHTSYITRHTSHVARSRPSQDAKPLVGNSAPDFTAEVVLDQEFVTKSLSDYRGKFYPLDFTFVCPTEITSFSDRYDEFKSLNCEVLGVSVDSQFSHLAWIQTPRNEGGIGDINYGLVADLKKEVSTAYNVLTDDGIALRGLFLIDREGVIQHSTINNLAFGRSVDETLRVLQAIQHIQNNPDEVCPAGWTPGDKTMNPTPEGSKEYFQAL